MSINDLLLVFQWWTVWLLLGLAFLPLTAYIFAGFFDRGYIFAKVLGILLLSFVAWFLGSLRILPFSTLTLFIIWTGFIAFNSYLVFRQKPQKSNFLTIRQIGIYLLEEGLFLGGLIFWSFVRAHEPSIHGLEKFMDFGFINSILRSEYFPPKDLWMTPLNINYYYFGHLSAAIATKISGIDSVITYNLILASLFATTLAASFSISANLYHFFSSKANSVSSILHTKYSILSGLLGALLVALGGNLHTIYIFFQTYNPESPLPFWQLLLKFNPEGYWYPNATRFIPFTIHEFPSYSFVVADLHGHVLNIPFVLLTIALLLKIFHQEKLRIIDYVLLGLLAAVSLMTNVLDGPIYLLVIFLVLYARQLIGLPLTAHPRPTAQDTVVAGGSLQSLVVVGKQFAIIILGTIIFSLPFWLSFAPFAQGVGVLCAPEILVQNGKIGPFLFEANHCARSPFWMLAVLWGFFYAVLISFILFSLKLLKSPKFLKLLNPTDLLVFTLALGATILILIPELFYVKDIYPAHYRANTVFKFGYQAFIIFGLICAYMLTRILTASPKTIRYALYAVPLLFLFLLVSIYPYFAINSYYGNLQNYRGLNGINYLAPLYPTDYQAILWLRENIKGQPVILEAQGDSYTDFARVSSNTGLPTVIGWPVHEWLWRGSYNEAGKRVTEVAQAYESTDINYTQEFLRKYDVRYVFVGDLERQKYSGLNESQFGQLGKIIFQSGNTRIYQIDL